MASSPQNHFSSRHVCTLGALIIVCTLAFDARYLTLPPLLKYPNHSLHITLTGVAAAILASLACFARRVIQSGLRVVLRAQFSKGLQTGLIAGIVFASVSLPIALQYIIEGDLQFSSLLPFVLAVLIPAISLYKTLQEQLKTPLSVRFLAQMYRNFEQSRTILCLVACLCARISIFCVALTVDRSLTGLTTYGLSVVLALLIGALSLHERGLPLEIPLLTAKNKHLLRLLLLEPTNDGQVAP